MVNILSTLGKREPFNLTRVLESIAPKGGAAYQAAASACDTTLSNRQRRATDSISTLSPDAWAPRTSGTMEIMSQCG